MSAHPPGAGEQNLAGSLERRIDQAWDVTLQRFFHPRTLLFYDYLTSFEPGHTLDHLPTADEIRHRHPNVCGWGTGMEDSAINGGAMLAMLCDRHAIRPDESTRAQARLVFRGLKSLAEIHGVPGFVARSVCPTDLTSVYPNSSRDQYTHAVHGMWYYYRSELSSDHERADIRRILCEIAAYAERFATPEHGYTLADLDGKPAVCSKMLEVAPHEAARLPMFYAAAWCVSGDTHWRDSCLRHLDAALDQSLELDPRMAAYPKLQMQCSLELLRDSGICTAIQLDKCLASMRVVADSMASNSIAACEMARGADLRVLFPDWRKQPLYPSNGLQVPDVLWGSLRPVFLSVREIGEAALTHHMASDITHSTIVSENLAALVATLDHEHYAGYGILYLQAAYWRGQRRLRT